MFTYVLAVSAVGLVILGLCVGGIVIYVGMQPDPGSVPPKPTRRAPPPPEADEEATIMGFAPMLLGEAAQADWADSEVTEARELGTTNTLIHDASAADEETSAAFAMMLVSAVGQTHKGKRRKRNEDRYLVLERHNLFVVADGMGGYVGGQIAAQIAVDTIQVAFDTNSFEGNTPTDAPRDGAQMAASFQMANRAIWDRTRAEPELEGMGTTLVGARFSPRKERVYICHVGDSRCYRLRDRNLEQLMADHTLKEMGITGKNAAQLTRAVGVAPGVEVDLTLAEPQVGDLYLICSDGLTKMVKSPQIIEILGKNPEAEDAVRALIEAANDNGGKDNITVIVVNVLMPTVGVIPHDRDTEAAEVEEAAAGAEEFAAEAKAAIDQLAKTATAELAEKKAAEEERHAKAEALREAATAAEDADDHTTEDGPQ
jgi:protein phosphatase